MAHPIRRAVALMASIALLASLALLLSGCRVSEKKDGESKNVEVKSPFGDIKVQNQADTRDIGLTLYPGAREKKDQHDGDQNQANVNMSFGNFGLKVVAATYESDDSPDKILSFYRNELKRYGSILECKGGHVGNVTMSDDKDGKELKCDSKGDSSVVELKVGEKNLQRVVAVKPNGNGSEFSLVYVRTSGGDHEEPI